MADENTPSIFTANWVHIVQTIAIVIPVLVAVVAGYIALRTEVSASQSDVKTLQAAMSEVRAEERTSSQELRITLEVIKAQISRLQIDFGIEAGLQASRERGAKK
jgi:mannitol-specific phosphotransferase system IIBC component